MEIRKEFLIEEYINKLKSIDEIKKEYNIPKKKISKYLHYYNIQILSKFDRNVIKYKDAVTNDYLNNKSMVEIAKSYNIAPNTIKKILDLNNITIKNSDEMSSFKNYERRKTNRLYQVDFDYFKKWSCDMAYILGFIYADGNVYKNRLKIELQRGDKELLNIIKKKLKYEGNILDAKTSIKDRYFETARLQISCKDICEDLNKLGVVENKSLSITFPNIPEEYLIDFIHGFFDGDGSVELRKQYNTYQLRVRFCSGSHVFIHELMNKLTRYGLKEKNIQKKKNFHCYEITFSTKESLILYNLMYHVDNELFLTRKKEIFNKYLLIKNSNL